MDKVNKRPGENDEAERKKNRPNQPETKPGEDKPFEPKVQPPPSQQQLSSRPPDRPQFGEVNPFDARRERAASHHGSSSHGGQYQGQSHQPQSQSQGGDQRGNQDAVRTIEVQMNALAIKTQCEKVKRYHVTMVKTLKSGIEKDVTITPKNNQAAIMKENCVFAIMQTLVERNPDIFGSDRYKFAYDGGSTLYTCNFDMPEEKEWVFSKKDLQDFPEAVREGLGNYEKIVIGIKYTGYVQIKGCDPSDPNREANKFFDVVLSASTKNGDFLNYGQRTFQKEEMNEQDIGQGKVIKKGLEKSTKVVRTESGEAKILLQVSSTASAFQKPIAMTDFICELLGIGDRDFNRAVTYMRENFKAREKVNNELRNMFVKTIHINRSFSIKGISKESAQNYLFENKTGVQVSVKDYFAAIHNIELRYPNAPLAVEVFAGKTSVHPLELLRVAAGQKVGTSRLGSLSDKVHKEAQLMPHQQKANLERELRKVNLVGAQNAYLQAFGISIEPDFVRTMARVMAGPERIGAKNTSEKRLIFAQGAEISKHKVVIVIIENCVPTQQAEDFWRNMLRQGEIKGMHLPKTAEIVERSRITRDMEQLFADWQQDEKKCPGLVFFITMMKKDDLHHVFKYYEDKCGILTQHVCVETVNQVVVDRIVTTENVLRKMNSKLGGVNHMLQPNRQEFAQHKGLLNDKMFIGLELSHPAAQSLFDRQAGSEIATPTVVGMAYSLDRVEKLSGTFWFQSPRLTTIQNLTHYMLTALTRHKDTTKKMARQLWIYRHGSSEGERKEMENEIECIREAVKKTKVQVQLVFILCISHSGTTLFPSRLPPAHQKQGVKAKEVNVPSGTVLDTGIEKTGVPEFFIKSQESNIGTSHMMRIQVLANDPNVSLGELEKTTHWLAFAHQVSSLPTSKPAVLYASDELAKRGGNHFKTDQMIWAENQEGGGYLETHSRFDIRDGESTEDYYQRKSDEAQSKFRHHFWA